MIENNTSGANGDSSMESPSKSANTSTNAERKDVDSSNCKSPVSNANQEKHFYAKLPWGVLKQTQNLSFNLQNLITSVPNVNIDDNFFKIENKKPGEYLMNLIVFKFIQLSSKKISQVMNGDKRHLKEFFQQNEDPDFEKLISTMAQVAEKSLPSLMRTLLMWHEAQISNLTYLKFQNQQQNDSNSLNASSKAALKTKQCLIRESDILEERKELIVNCILCSSLKEILKQLPFHPGIDDLLNYIIDLSFQRFVPKETSPNSSSSYYQHHQLYLDNRFTIDLFAECIGVIAHSRFALVKSRFLNEFDRLKSNKSPSQSTLSSNLSGQVSNQPSAMSIQQNPSPGLNCQTQQIGANSAPSMNQTLHSSQSIIKLLMGMKFIRIKMVPIEDFEASFQFLNELAQYFVDVKDKDIKHTLAGLFVEILVPIIGIVKNEVNVPCLKSFVDILYHHALELTAKSKHRLASLPLLTCLLCVSQKQFFLNYWFTFAQLCFQQMKSKETTLSRIALESVIRLVWVYMIRIKGEKSSDTNVKLNAIVQSLFPKGSKLVIPKEMPANLYVKMINYIAYEKLDYAMKDIIYELLSIDVNQIPADFADQLTSANANTLSSSGQSSTSNGVSLGTQLFKSSKENMIILPLRMEIGLKAFILISDTLQSQKENPNPPAIPSNFTTPDTDQLTIYPNQTLSDSFCREIGIGIYFDQVRRAFQDILKTLDTTIGRGYLMTRPENTGSASTEDTSQITNPIQDEQNNLDELTSYNSQKESIFSSDMKSRLNLFRTCIALMPRLMPCFRETELVEILTRLTIHLDDELKLTAFKTLKTLVSNYPTWRKPIFTGFTNFMLKEISDMFPKLIENALKMLIQLLNSWKNAVSDEQNLEDSCQILYHLEGFSLFTLCHSSIQRRRFGHFILQECKQIGESIKCFKIYTQHNYAIDILDLASAHAIRSLHLQCFNINLTIHNTRLDLGYLIEQSAIWDSCINLSNYSDNTQTNSLPTQSKNQRTASMSADVADSQNEIESSSEPSSLPNGTKICPEKINQTQENFNYVFTFDPWTECLAIFFAYDFIFTRCPQARANAWLFIFARLQQILPFVDPNEPHEPARTSLLFGNNALERSRKIGERDINLNLWKNYLIGACCLTTGSDQDIYSSEYRKYTSRIEDALNLTPNQNLNPTSTAVNYDFTIVESTSKFYANFGTHTSLIKIIVPYLKCDMTYFREIIIRGLGRINIEAQRDLIEELNPIIKETSDFKRQDKIRRLKKKDLARLALVRIFELMAEQKTLSKRIMDTFKNQETNSQEQHFNDEQMRKIFIDFIDTIHGYLESEGEKSYNSLNQIRLHFSMFIYKFIDSVAKEKRSVIFHDPMRQNLFNLIVKWSGKFSIKSKDQAKLSVQSKNLFIHQNHFAHLNCYHYYDELELASARACAALLYSSNAFDTANNKNLDAFSWLNNLFEVVNSEMKLYESCKYQVSNEAYTLAMNCLTQLLDLNLYTIANSSTPSGNNINLSLNVSPIFDWTIDKCYATMSQEIADLCFLCLSKVYLNYLNQTQANNLTKNTLLKSSFESIYLGPILSITLLNLGSNRLNIHEASVTLIRAMNKNFLQDAIDCNIMDSMVMASKSQAFISEYLAKKNPDQTMFIFCELTSHFESCTSLNLRRAMLNILVPWLYNIQLINPNVITNTNKHNFNNVLQLESEYGSVEASHLVLNNLFYLTCKFSDNFGSELELLWASLASTWHSNLKIICRYIYVMISLAPYDVICHAKRIVCYLSRICPERLIDDLTNELEMIDSFTSHVSRENHFPFYRYLKTITVPASPPPSPNSDSCKKASIYFVNQENYHLELDESIDLMNQSDLNLEGTENENSDLSHPESSELDSESYQNLKKSQYSPPQLKLDQSQLPLPVKFQSFACPLNKILNYSNNNHQQQNFITNHDYIPLFSYQNNYLHHNHYFHFNNLQRGSVSLMLLSEIVSNDGADFDWTEYFPILFHYCLLNFDNPRQLIAEHAKKLFLSLIFIITVQNEQHWLKDYLIESLDSIIDGHSLIYDRKYKSTDSDGHCYYNFNFNSNFSAHSAAQKSHESRSFISIHSAPSSPAQSQSNQKKGSWDKKRVELDTKDDNLTEAKDHLAVLIDILRKCKNGPVWPFEYITRHNYEKQLKSVEILTTFVDNLKGFISICLPTKQISVISSTRSVSSPLNSTNKFDKAKQLDKNWSIFALNVSFNTSNRHYAGRSLQIHRALNIKMSSLSTMKMFIGRLKDIVADAKEDVQGYVAEILLTLKMNAIIMASEHINDYNGTILDINQKHKSKSLKLKQDKPEIRKKSSTAIGSEMAMNLKKMDLRKQKSATLPRKQTSQLIDKSWELERFSPKFKHQVAFRKCLTLSLFNYKWQVLQDRVGTSILANKKYSKFLSILNSEQQQKSLHSNETNMKILSQIFWLAMCLLESDYKHEFSLACDILSRILEKIDLSETKSGPNEFRRTIELFSYRLNWSNFPGLQNLLLKGCTNSDLIEKSQYLISLLIPYCCRLIFVDPYGASFYGMWGLSMNLLSVLPTMILHYDNPNHFCIESANRYLKIIGEISTKLEKQSGTNSSVNKGPGYQKTKIEQLKNLNLVIELYTRKSFGKDKNQWAKCVITYMSEFFNLCECELTSSSDGSGSKTKFYYNWIVLLVEILEKSTSNAYQSAVLVCLSSLLNFVNFGDKSAWTFINEELLRVASKLSYSMLHSEVLDLIKLTVGKSSSLLDNDKKDSPRFFLNETNQTKSSVPLSNTQLFGKRELPGRTLDFDFDFSWLVPAHKKSSGLKKNFKSSSNLDLLTQIPPLNLINFHTNEQFNFLNMYLNGINANVWDNPMESQIRTRERIMYIYTALNKNQVIDQSNEDSSDSFKTSMQKSNSALFENSLNGLEPQKPDFRVDNDENFNLITNTTLNNSNISATNSTSSRISKKDMTNSPSTSEQSKSTSTSANQTSSNNSFNQTSFVFSPDKDTKKEDTHKQKPVAPIIPENAFSRTHNRANSLSLNKQNPVVSIVSSGVNTLSGNRRPIGLSLANNTPGVSQQVLNTLDDNIFINNTFSFLDELDSNYGDIVANMRQNDPSQNKNDYESFQNFPWHTILPVKEQESDQQNSQTMSLNSSNDALSKSYSSTSDLKNELLLTMSKNKPMAPKIKAPATIGVASGISTMKNLGLSNTRSDGTSDKPGERTRSVTRIVSNENLTSGSLKKDKSQSSKSKAATNLIYDHYLEQNKASSSTINSTQEPIIKNSINKNSSPGSPTSLIRPKTQYSKILEVNNLSSNENIHREIALNLLEGKSRSLSRSTIENNENSDNEWNKKSNTRISNEEQLKLEADVKNIFQSSLPWIKILNLSQDEIDRAWKSHIQNMLNTSKLRGASNRMELSLESLSLWKNFNPLESFYLFKKLFVQAKHRLNNLVSECFQYLTIETKLFLKLEKHIFNILDLLKNKLDCPLVYFDLEWFMQVQDMFQSTSPNKNFAKSPLKVASLISTSFIDNHKRILWEIGENYDTFVYIKHDVTDSLESIKKLDKSSKSSLRGSSEINSKIEKFFKKIELSRKFCKLVSQFMILLQSYSKLFPNLTKNLSNTTLTDLSVEMTNLKRSLKTASSELEQNGRLSPMFPVDLEKTLLAKSPQFKTFLPNSKEVIIYWILEAIKQESYTKAIEYYKIGQKNWPNDFNKSNQTDNELEFDPILILVCEQARQKSSNMIAIIEPETDFVEINQTILQEIIEITNMVNIIDKKFKENISSVFNDNDNDDYEE